MAAGLPDGSAALPDNSLAAIAPTIARSLQSNDSFRTIHKTQVRQHTLRICSLISGSMCGRHDMAGDAIAWLQRCGLSTPDI